MPKVSRYYAGNHRIVRTDDWLVLKLNEEVGELTQAYLARCGQSRRTAAQEDLDVAFRAELADVLAHLLLICHRFGADLQREVDSQWLVHLDAATSTSGRT